MRLARARDAANSSHELVINLKTAKGLGLDVPGPALTSAAVLKVWTGRSRAFRYDSTSPLRTA